MIQFGLRARSRVLAFLLLLSATLLLLSACSGSGGSSSGDSSDRYSERIVNGVAINQADLPPVIRLFLVVPGQLPQFICSATFISPNHALTAAHCLVFPEIGQIPAQYLGVEIEPGRIVPAAGVASHPAFAVGGYAPSAEYSDVIYVPGDIGIVVVSEPYTGPLAAVSSRTPYQGQEILLAGYGSTHTDLPADQQLRVGKVTVDAVSMSDGAFYWVFDTVIESNTCYGDSGGPALTMFAPGEPLVIVGVTSGGLPTCEIPSYSWDTLVPHPYYLDFVNFITGGQFAFY